MKFFMTGVGGQLGHDVMKELAKRGHMGVGSDMAPAYSGVADGSKLIEKLREESVKLLDNEALIA